VEWNRRRYRVLRYDDARKGAAVNIETGDMHDPFFWRHLGERCVRVTKQS
jgi:hypothetical protein